MIPTAGGFDVKMIYHENSDPHPTEYREQYECYECETALLTPHSPRPEGVDYCGQKS